MVTIDVQPWLDIVLAQWVVGGTGTVIHLPMLNIQKIVSVRSGQTTELRCFTSVGCLRISVICKQFCVIKLFSY